MKQGRKIGHYVSEETRKKIGLGNNGKIVSKKVRKKISKNSAKFWLGKKLSSKHIHKLKESHKGKYGKLSSNWKNGKTKIRKLLPSLYEYKKWRSNVFQRDNWTCQTCNIRGGYLEAHHIKELCKIIDEYKIKNSRDANNCKFLWDINNGVTLCKKCHKLTKRGKNTIKL